jgi:hypothetical protein
MLDLRDGVAQIFEEAQFRGRREMFPGYGRIQRAVPCSTCGLTDGHHQRWGCRPVRPVVSCTWGSYGRRAIPSRKCAYRRRIDEELRAKRVKPAPIEPISMPWKARSTELRYIYLKAAKHGGEKESAQAT